MPNAYVNSGAGTILGQGGGGQDQMRQSLERGVGLFAEIGLFFVPKQAFSKKKRSSPES